VLGAIQEPMHTLLLLFQKRTKISAKKANRVLTPMDRLQREERRSRSQHKQASSLNCQDVPVSLGVQTCMQWLTLTHGNL